MSDHRRQHVHRARWWRGRARHLPLVVLPLLLSAAVYHPILANYFWGDDFTHLWEIEDWGVARFLAKRHGGHVYWLRNLAFAATYHFAGFDPRLFFACVLATHLLNVWLLFGLLRELGTGPSVAVFGAALWGILPVHEGTLGWYSAYGQVLSTTALLWFLGELARAAKRPAGPTTARTLAWCGVLLAGAACHGNGLTVSLVAAIVAGLVLPRSPAHTRAVAVLSALPVATAVLYAASTWLDARFAGGSGRLDLWPANFSGAAPLIAEAWLRLLENAIASTLLPYGCIGQIGWWPCGAVAAAFAIAVLAAMMWADRLRRQLAAWLVLLVALYGTIAFVRAPIAWYFSLTLPELAVGARFHYLGTLPVVLMLSSLLALVRDRVAHKGWLQPLFLGTWIAVVIGAWLAAPAIDHHDVARAATSADLERIRERIDEAAPGSEVVIANASVAGIDRRIFAGSVALFMLTQPSDVVRGRRVYFRESDPAALAVYRAFPAGRTASLLVGPDQPTATQR